MRQLVARTYAPLLTSIWSDPDFTTLSSAAQRVYMLAISQPTISYCGVVTFTARRWARLASDSSPADITAAIGELADARFVVVDEDAEELWVRSFVRHNGVLKSPNIAKRMDLDFVGIFSARIRELFLGELGDAPAGCANITAANLSRRGSGNPSTESETDRSEPLEEPPGSGSGSGQVCSNDEFSSSSVSDGPTDDDRFVEVVAEAVDLKVAAAGQVRNLPAYRASVARSVPTEHGDTLRQVLAHHPAWPANWVAQEALGQPRTNPTPREVIDACPDCTNGLVETDAGMAPCPSCSWARNGNRTGAVT